MNFGQRNEAAMWSLSGDHVTEIAAIIFVGQEAC